MINCRVTNPLVLQNFWVTPPSGVRAAQFVYPHDRMRSSASWCDAKYASGTRTVDWPNLRAANGGKVFGAVHVGAHGDFVSGAASASATADPVSECRPAPPAAC
jgi:hypothetical protein